MVTFLLLILFAYSNDAVIKSITLNNTNLDGLGIDIQLTDHNVNNTNDIWHLDPPTQDATDIEIIMNNEWGFHPDVESTISLRIDGFTPNITEDDGQLLILFGVGDKQYFATFISLAQGEAWKSYPSWSANAPDPGPRVPLATTDSIASDIIYRDQPSRYHRLSAGNSTMDNWVNIGPGSGYKNLLHWPLNIEIINNPITNTTTYVLPDQGLNVIFATSFATNQGMNIYIMNDASDGRWFDIYSIDVIYTYYTETPSNAPTYAPSGPSIPPTETPTTPHPFHSPTSPHVTLQVGGDTTNTGSPTQIIEVHVSDPSGTTDKGPGVADSSDISSNHMTLILCFIIVVVLLGFLILSIGVYLYSKQRHGKRNKKEHQYQQPQAQSYDNDSTVTQNRPESITMPLGSLASHTLHDIVLNV